MNILTIENLTKAFGERKIFDEAQLSVQDTEKVGLIGINGTGKSTLLKIVAGIEQPDSGSVIKARHVVIGYLPQNPEFLPEETQIQAIHRMLKDQNIPDVDSQAKTMMTKLGVSDYEKKCGQLSGGQRKRLALVAVLLSKSDLLILDEPTNHLDQEMAGWLEEQLRSYKGAILMVTHDRYFLDSVTNRIVELDHGKLYSYNENYSGYLEKKAEREAMEDATFRKAKSLYRTELEWVRRGAQARSTKQKARLQRFEELKNTKAPERDSTVELSTATTRLGRTTVELQGLSKAYGDKKLFEDFTYIFLKNDRIGFVGSNGCGKTTLMKMIHGDLKPDSGEVIVGQTVKMSYYAQEISDETMNPKLRVIDYVRETAEFVDTAEGKLSAAKMLERFLFAGEDQYGLISKLSGGEKRRLYLLKILMESPNVLILDEPTNDLDIATLRILEDYLDVFQGIVIVVSHDRYFMDRVVRRVFAFEGNGTLRQSEGGYSDYLLRKEFEGVDITSISEKSSGTDGEKLSKSTWKDPTKKKLKFTYMEEKEYKTIESDIAALEEKIENIEQEILKNAKDFVKLNELTREKDQCSEELEQKMDRWMYLEELAAKIEAEGK